MKGLKDVYEKCLIRVSNCFQYFWVKGACVTQIFESLVLFFKSLKRFLFVKKYEKIFPSKKISVKQ